MVVRRRGAPRSGGTAGAGRVAALLGSWIAVGACSDGGRPGVPPALSSAVPQGATATEVGSTTAAPAPAAAAPTWLELVRLERFREAWKLLGELPEVERAKPEMRFLLARVAARIGRPEEVVKLTEGLAFAGFEEEIAELRAEASLAAGPYEGAAAFFEKRGSASDLVKASRAALALRDAPRALTLADRALVTAQKQKRVGDERKAHAARARALAELKDEPKALTSLEWLATKFPHTPEGKEALERLPPKALSTEERRQVVLALLDAGAGKDALARLEAWAASFKKQDLAHYRATAEYKARRYKAAAEAFLAAAKKDDARAPEQLYYAARSLARSKREDDADKRYAEVERRFKKGPWVERATFQRASLLLSRGRYDDAAKAFTTYLAKFKDGGDRDEAEYALALALLSADEPAKAKTVFAKMASRAKKTDWGFLRELEGVAALRAKDEPGAVKIFEDVAREQPLTWAASMARARLSSLQKPLPPVILPPPDGLAAPLRVELPPKARSLAALGLDADAEAWLAANEGTSAAPYVGRETEALCAMYGTLSRAKRRYKVGAQSVGFELLMRAPAPHERWAWECLYPSPYGARVGELEEARKLPKGLVHAVMRQESTFDPDIRSPVGAIGLMQLMPTTAEEAAKEAKLPDFRADDVPVPEVNLQLGSFYLEKMLGRFSGSVPLAVAAYNGGPQAVSRWVENARELEADVFVARIPFEETRNYTMRVVSNLLRYQWLAGGDAAVTTLPLLLPKETSVGDDDY